VVFELSRGKQRMATVSWIEGYWVQKSVFELAQKLIDATLHGLSWKKPLKVDDICFHPDWNDWKLGLRIKLGRCLVHFVELGLLPLVIINPGKKGPLRYRRK
jgi:hypothetical protein